MIAKATIWVHTFSGKGGVLTVSIVVKRFSSLLLLAMQAMSPAASLFIDKYTVKALAPGLSLGRYTDSLDWQAGPKISRSHLAASLGMHWHLPLYSCLKELGLLVEARAGPALGPQASSLGDDFCLSFCKSPGANAPGNLQGSLSSATPSPASLPPILSESPAQSTPLPTLPKGIFQPSVGTLSHLFQETKTFALWLTEESED